MDYNVEIARQRIYRPMFNRFDIGDDKEKFLDVWDVYRTLPDTVKGILTSPEIVEKIKLLQQQLQLSDEVISGVSWVVREIFFGNIPVEKIASNLQKIGVGKDKVQSVILFFQKEIVTIKPSKKSPKEEIKTEQAVILDALAKYPRLNEQVITAARIKVRGEKEAVRGSVRNWLRAYRDAVGVRQHSAMERGQFIFQSENAKNLSQEEREKVSLILKSLDENAPLAIDPPRQEIVFPPMTVASPAPSQQAQASPSGQSLVSMPSAQNRPQPSIQSQLQPKQQASFQVSAGMKPTPQPSRLIPEASQWGGKTAFNFSKSALSSRQSVMMADESRQSVAEADGHPQTMRFSSGHTLPSEKQEVLQRDSVSAQSVPESSIRENLSRPSFGIDYINPSAPVRKVAPAVPQNAPRQGQPSKEVWQMPDTLKNVVDLRSDE